MFERYTERARQVVTLAHHEAIALHHDYIGTEHLLLGLLREEEGLAARVLANLDLTADEIRREVERITGVGTHDGSDLPLPFTPRAKKVCELALREALSLGHNFIGTEHILLGLIRENEGVASRILLDFNLDAQKVRVEIIRMLSGRAPVPRRVWARADVEVGQLWERAGRVFRVVGVCDEPTVTLEDVATETVEGFVIGAPVFGEFVRLNREQAQPETSRA